MKLDVYKKIINYSGVDATDSKLKVAFASSDDVLVASKAKESAPWLTASGHELSDILDPVIDERLNGMDCSSGEARNLVVKHITNALVAEIKPIVSQIIEDSKIILREMESYPVVKIHTEEKTRQIESLLTGRIQPLLRAPIIEFMPEEEKTLKKLETLLETDYPELFNKTKRYVKILLDLMKTFEADPVAKSAVGENSVKVFRDNCIVFKDGVTFRQVRALKEQPSEETINKVMFERKFDDVDALVVKLNG